jgi:hypothetical protein
MKAKTPQDIGSGPMGTNGKIQPNPTANDFRQFVLGGQLGFEQVQDRPRGQLTVSAVGGEGASF